MTREKRGGQRLKYLYWPNRRRAIATAERLLLQRSRRRFPVNPKELSRPAGLVWMTLDAAQQIIKGIEADDAAVMPLPELGMKVAVLNTDNVTGRSYWNVLHEIGHAALGHFDNHDLGWLDDRRYTDPNAARSLSALEREADIFATEVMMPGALVRALKPSQRELVEFFGASWEAAANRLTDRIAQTDLDKAITDHYWEFIDEILAIRVFREQNRPATRRDLDGVHV